MLKVVERIILVGRCDANDEVSKLRHNCNIQLNRLGVDLISQSSCVKFGELDDFFHLIYDNSSFVIGDSMDVPFTFVFRFATPGYDLTDQLGQNICIPIDKSSNPFIQAVGAYNTLGSTVAHTCTNRCCV